MKQIHETAKDFAVAAHGEQMYGDKPYSFHLDAVAALVTPYGTEAMAVAYLHDVVEDTSISIQEIKQTFGAKVAACVALLTDEPGENRKERKAKTYAKLAQVQGSNELALVVKTADRLANTRACLLDRKANLWEMYRAEHAVFRQSAYRQGLCDILWVELDSLLLNGDAVS